MDYIHYGSRTWLPEIPREGEMFKIQGCIPLRGILKTRQRDFSHIISCKSSGSLCKFVGNKCLCW